MYGREHNIAKSEIKVAKNNQLATLIFVLQPLVLLHFCTRNHQGCKVAKVSLSPTIPLKNFDESKHHFADDCSLKDSAIRHQIIF